MSQDEASSSSENGSALGRHARQRQMLHCLYFEDVFAVMKGKSGDLKGENPPKALQIIVRATNFVCLRFTLFLMSEEDSDEESRL